MISNISEDCFHCNRPICQVTIPRFHYKYLDKESTTLVDGVPAQNALLWDFFNYALNNCFQVQDFRVMLFYGLYEHDMEAFLKETSELPSLMVIRFLKQTNQVVKKITEDYYKFKHSFGSQTKITDLIPNIITILQMQLLEIASVYIKNRAEDADFSYSLQDVIV